MAQNSLTVGNVTASAARTALNNAFQALNSNHSGSSNPSEAVEGSLFFKTGGAKPQLQIKTSGGNFITIGELDTTNDDFIHVIGAYRIHITGTTLFVSHTSGSTETNIAKIDSSGNLTVAGDITAFGTV